MLLNEEPEDAIKAILTDQDRLDFPAALALLRDELDPLNNAKEHAEVAALLGRQIGLLKMNASSEQKSDWIKFALMDLSPLPRGHLVDALQQVRRVAKFEGEVVPMVCELVERWSASPKKYLPLVERLAEIAK